MPNEMLAEHDLVALRVDLPEHRLRAGDTGTVVSVHPASRAYTVEFMTLGGEVLPCRRCLRTRSGPSPPTRSPRPGPSPPW